LDEVVAVDSKNGILNIYGYKDHKYASSRVRLARSDVFAISYASWKPYVTIITVPFKVRRAIDTFHQSVQTAVTNVGLDLNLYHFNMDRYFASGNKSTHLLSI